MKPSSQPEPIVDQTLKDANAPANSSKPISGSRIGLFFLLMVLGLALDLGTKSWIFAQQGMPGEKPVLWVIQDVFGFQTSLNEGALFGVGQGCLTLFTVASFLTLGAIQIWLFCGKAVHSLGITVACSFISAGVLGNLYDRLGYPGLIWNYANNLHETGTAVFAVRDWILVMIGTWPWPNFNIADSLLVSGACLLFALSFLSESRKS